MTFRHFRHAGDSDSLIGSKAANWRRVREDGVHVALTLNPRPLPNPVSA
jgi:hypothetical protein